MDTPNLFTALILGIVEGLTEFIPVSSTGHMIIVGHYLNFQGELAETFEVFIQLGAILAIIFLMPRRFLELIPRKDDSALSDPGIRGLAGCLKVAVAVLPILGCGFILRHLIKEYLFNPTSVSLSLITGALLMINAERFKDVRSRTVSELTLRDALLIGLAQTFALWPGMSRSGMTMVGGMFLGFSRIQAAEFSFFIAVPTMFAATLYDLYKSLNFITLADLPMFATGFITSFVVALLSVKLFLRLLTHVNLVPFALYRIALAAMVMFLG